MTSELKKSTSNEYPKHLRIMYGMDLIKINGKVAVDDPVKELYEVAGERIKKLDWEKFEQLSAETLEQIGFSDVQRLTRGSQQGKDIIATWYSRFSLGKVTRFRFQCKHRKTNKLITKRDIGDSISDFLLQNNDEILIVLTNGRLSNDLLDLFDKAVHKGVYPLTAYQFIRFVLSCPLTALKYLDLDSNFCKSLRHFFDVREFYEGLCLSVNSNNLVYRFNRFWTEPYMWFFRKTEDETIERLWTIFGGEFSFTCFNRTQEVQNISGLKLKLIHKENLPNFGIINITPKGGKDIHRITVKLSANLEEYLLVPKDNTYLSPGGSFSSIIDFDGIDPGIYHFKIFDVGPGGSTGIRESDTYKIAYVPDPYPKGFIEIHESWPTSLILIEELFDMTEQARKEMLGEHESHIFLNRSETGELQIKYQHENDKSDYIVPEMSGYKSKHPLANYVDVGGNRKAKAKFLHLWQWKDWCEEWLDESEPRSPLHRVKLLKMHNNENIIIHDALIKAFERTPSHPKINMLIFFEYYDLGYLGFAKFHLNVAYISSPTNPAIAGIHFIMAKITNNIPQKQEYVKNFSEIGIKGFNNLIKYDKIPKSYNHAFEIAFPDEPNLRDYWTEQHW